MQVAGGTGQSAGGAAGIANPVVDDWKAVRDLADIQYAPLPVVQPDPPRSTPEWLIWLSEALQSIFGPLGRWLGVSWPIFQYALIAIAGVLALFLLWRVVVKPALDWWRHRKPVMAQAAWTPERADAVALLEDADRLAAEGQFGKAVHLLLQRSVRQIKDARPDWLSAATTAREIAVLPMLPDTGRHAFAIIADRSERAVFALRDLDGQDWTAARGAYARFAQLELRA